MQNIITRLLDIQNDQYNLDSARIAGTILLHFNEVPQLTIYQLADFCHTSPTTLSRFIRKYTGSSYSSFKAMAFHTIIDYDSLNRCVEAPGQGTGTARETIDYYASHLENVIHRFLASLDPDVLDQMVCGMHDAGTIYLSGSELLGARAFEYDMVMYGKRTLFIQAPHCVQAAVEHMNADSFVLFLITPDRVNRSAQATIQQAANAGAQIGILMPEEFHPRLSTSFLGITYHSTDTEMDNEIARAFMHMLTVRFRTRYIDNARNSSYSQQFSKSLQDYIHKSAPQA